MQKITLTPSEVHKIANYLARKKRTAREFGVHWETVRVEVSDGSVYVTWQEDQGGPYLQYVPVSAFILRLNVEEALSQGTS